MATKSKRCVGSEKEKDSTQYYDEMARKARAEALELANKYKLSPLTFEITNVIKMKVQVTQETCSLDSQSVSLGDRHEQWVVKEGSGGICGLLTNC